MQIVTRDGATNRNQMARRFNYLALLFRWYMFCMSRKLA